MKHFFYLFFFISISSFSQEEKRIALVIGNADYDKGKLSNPVNDANLIAESLEKLDFEVFLHTNLATRREMGLAIQNFGRKRKDYDIAFVYYAGHGIQLNNQNYLLPVKEIFEGEDDVEFNAISMQRVLRYLESTREGQLNFIVLDACRNNPFEQNWNKTRSLKGGGLAKIPPPTGSLIAFSTDHGQTAADGDGGNSLYSQVLASKMLEEDVSIEQVFKNVRTEVLKISEAEGQIQSPVEESKLTGKSFFLKPINFIQIAIDYNNNGQYEETLNAYQNAIKHRPELNNDPWLLTNIGLTYSNLGSNDKAIEYYTLSIEKDSTFILAYSNRAYEYSKLKMYKEALDDYNTALDIAPNDLYTIHQRAAYYHWMGENEKALKDYQKAYELDSKTKWYLQQIAIEYQLTKQYEKAIETYLEYLEFDPNNKGVYNNLAMIYSKLEEFEKALKYINKAIEIDATPGTFTVRGGIYIDIGKISTNSDLNYFEKALQDLTKAIELAKNLYYNDDELSNSKSLARYQAFYEGRIQFFITTNQYELAIKDINTSIKIDNSSPDNYYKLFYIFNEQNKYFDAYIQINNCIAKAETKTGKFYIHTIDYEDDLGILDLYLLRADISKKIKNYTGSCEDYNTALELTDEDADKRNEIEELISKNCNNQ